MSAPESLHVWVLHSRPWKESSVLLDAFSAERGRLRLVARGVKGRKRSPLAGLLQPFVPLQIQCLRSGEWWTLREAELQGQPLGLRDDAALCGLYANELLLRLLPEQDAHPQIYIAYARLLHALVHHVEPANLRAFEWALLQDLGYAIDLQQDAEGQPLASETSYVFHAHEGWRVALSPQAAQVRGQQILKLASGDWRSEAAFAKRLLRHLLDAHLGDKPLQSRLLWQTRAVLREAAADIPDPVANATADRSLAALTPTQNV